MKLIEIFGDYLVNNVYLIEMAIDRNEAKKKVSTKAKTLKIHIIKVLIMPKADARSHWIREIDGYLNDMYGICLKPSCKIPKQKDFENWIINNSSVNVNAILEEISFMYKNEKIVIPKNIENSFRNILYEICEVLSKGVSPSIERLVNKYL